MRMNPTVHGDGDRAIGIAVARSSGTVERQTPLGRYVVGPALADLHDVPLCHPGLWQGMMRQSLDQKLKQAARAGEAAGLSAVDEVDCRQHQRIVLEGFQRL